MFLQICHRKYINLKNPHKQQTESVNHITKPQQFIIHVTYNHNIYLEREELQNFMRKSAVAEKYGRSVHEDSETVVSCVVGVTLDSRWGFDYLRHRLWALSCL